MRTIPPAAVDLVARWEGKRLEAYPDPATGGEPWTIGYGHTGNVKPGDKITEARARVLLKEDLKAAANAVHRKIGEAIVAELTDNQWAALLSFAFNLGTGNPKKPEWTIWKRLRARQFDQVPGEIIKFVNANGKKMQGLVNRRTDEIRVWSLDEPGSEDVQLTSLVTRNIATPPTPADPTPAHKSVSIWGAITAPILAAGAWVANLIQSAPDFIKPVLDAINPFSDKSPIIQNVSTALYTALAGISAFVAFSALKKKREARR